MSEHHDQEQGRADTTPGEPVVVLRVEDHDLGADDLWAVGGWALDDDLWDDFDGPAAERQEAVAAAAAPYRTQTCPLAEELAARLGYTTREER